VTNETIARDFIAPFSALDMDKTLSHLSEDFTYQNAQKRSRAANKLASNIFRTGGGVCFNMPQALNSQ